MNKERGQTPKPFLMQFSVVIERPTDSAVGENSNGVHNKGTTRKTAIGRETTDDD